MKFEPELSMKAKLSKDTMKKGIERDKGQFDGLEPGESKLVTKDEIIGKNGEGKPYVILITGKTYFKLKEE